MKKIFIFATAVTISTSAFAGNMSESTDKKAIHSQEMDKQSIDNILQNEDMERLHREMTLYAMSEVGMEARLKMMTKEGRAYHKALKDKKNTAS